MKKKFLLAIDIGSNAIRAALACYIGDQFEIINTYRFPVRLGEDAFLNNIISPTKVDAIVKALKDLQEETKDFHFECIEAIATSALRDVDNNQDVIWAVENETGIKIKIVTGEEEARLVHKAAAFLIDIKNYNALLIDIGGGSTEISFTSKGEVIYTRSFQCGTVRLLNFSDEELMEETIKNMMQEVSQDLSSLFPDYTIDICIGIGGSFGRLGKLRKFFFQKKTSKIFAHEFFKIHQELEILSIKNEMNKLRMDKDKTDVLIPAMNIISALLQSFTINEILLPNTGLKEGIILDLL